MEPFNASVITERLVVGGGIVGPDELAWLAQQGVTHILNCAVELDDSTLAAAAGLAYAKIAWADDGQSKPVSDFVAGYLWLLQSEVAALAVNRQVGLFVHCASGHNRGPLMATFLLAAASGLPADTAWLTIKGGRPVATAFDNPTYRQSALTALDTVRPFRLSIRDASPEPAPAQAVAEPGATITALANAAGAKRAGGRANAPVAEAEEPSPTPIGLSDAASGTTAS